MKTPRMSLFLIIRIILFLACLARSASAQITFSVVHSFDQTDGSNPNSLVQGHDGKFYGTTFGGGANNYGTVFQITPSGTLSLLHSFNGADGQIPRGLIQGTDEKFYGTTPLGGAGTICAPGGCGTIFSIVPGGSLVTLYSFCTQPSCFDGWAPSNGLVEGTDGNFYGTTSDNAAPDSCIGSCGSFFKITPSGTLTTLYTFNGGTGPSGPNQLVQGIDGNFYGFASGGNENCGFDRPLYCGTIFKLTPSGVLLWVYSFCAQDGCPDGAYPSVLMQAADGNLYGGTESGGANGDGTGFKISPSGSLTTIHSFDMSDGGGGVFGLVQSTDGNFYGTTGYGGENGNGTLFKMTSTGVLITLFSFNGTDGSGPDALLQAPNGVFYGATGTGGSGSNCSPANCGTIFSLTVPMGGTTPSATVLSLAPSSIVVGSAGPIVMTATVAPQSGGGMPTGAVEFFNGSNAIGSADLNNGVASFDYNPSSLPVNSYQLSATYSGDATFAASTSAAENLTVNPVILQQVATPTFSPPSGTYGATQSVTISDATAGATIYYTNDGTTPTTSSAVYSSPIAVNTSRTLMAMAAASGYSISAVANATYTINLSPDYQLSVNPSSLTIAAGQTATAAFTVTPMNGFNSAVSFACSGLPTQATCSFNPPSVTPDGSSVNSILTISTTASSVAIRGREGSSPRLIYALALFCITMTLAVGTRGRHARKGFNVVAVLTLMVGLLSCGSSKSGNSGTPIGTSTVMVTAAAGASSHTASLKLTITQ